VAAAVVEVKREKLEMEKRAKFKRNVSQIIFNASGALLSHLTGDVRSLHRKSLVGYTPSDSDVCGYQL
jgi:hypothetical protein